MNLTERLQLRDEITRILNTEINCDCGDPDCIFGIDQASAALADLIETKLTASSAAVPAVIPPEPVNDADIDPAARLDWQWCPKCRMFVTSEIPEANCDCGTEHTDHFVGTRAEAELEAKTLRQAQGDKPEKPTAES